MDQCRKLARAIIPEHALPRPTPAILPRLASPRPLPPPTHFRTNSPKQSASPHCPASRRCRAASINVRAPFHPARPSSASAASTRSRWSSPQVRRALIGRPAFSHVPACCVGALHTAKPAFTKTKPVPSINTTTTHTLHQRCISLHPLSLTATKCC